MKDDQALMKIFVKMVEAYPEIYDKSVNGYRTGQADQAWENIADRVRNELYEECTVDELKVKWKGIRSSFNRYKNKLLGLTEASCKKYYLYDHLRYLDPHARPKCMTSQESTEKIFDDSFCNYDDDDDDNNDSNEYNPLDEWTEVDVKPDVQNIHKEQKINIFELTATRSNARNSVDSDSKKRQTEDRNTEDDNEDLQFFRSILPDIKNFTSKEKRKLKMDILQLIDDVENERKRQKPNK